MKEERFTIPNPNGAGYRIPACRGGSFRAEWQQDQSVIYGSIGKEFIWHKIERDEEIIQMLISVESDFWNNNVLANKMPAPDGSKAAEELLSKYYKTSDPDKMIPLVGFDEKLKRRAEITALQDKLEKEKKQIEQEVKVYMEDAEKADSDSYSVTWKSVTANRVDTKKLQTVYPEVYKECAKPSQSRRFTVKEIA